MIVFGENHMPNVASLLRDHVTLQLDCVDRLYCNGYVPNLQRPENLWWFFTQHRGCPVLSPVLLKRLSDDFVRRIRQFADHEHIPIVYFEKGQRKEDVARKHLRRLQRRNVDDAVVCIGVAQEKVSGFRPYQKGKRRRARGKPPCFAFYRGSIHVNQYYFYILDRDFGLCFIKFSSYLPFGIKVWLNGHDWVKRQLAHANVDFTELDNGFLSCPEPQLLQHVADQLGPAHIQHFFRRWLRRLPHPFTRADRQAGLRYELSILQMEVSLTQVLDRPLHGRQFFEEVIRDNLDIGRPDRVQLLFERRVTRRTPGFFRTRVLTAGVQPSLRFDYKRTRVKQYFKLQRALRTETTFNDTRDFRIGRRLENFVVLRTLGRHINHRLLTLERVSHNCALAPRTVERVVLPSTDQDDNRIPALRWAEPRTQALLPSLCAFAAAPEGFTNATLRTRVGQLFDAGPAGYHAGRMTYDLRRLRLNRIISRIPHTNRYVLTPLGRRIAFFMTKAYARVVRPVFARTDPAVPDHSPDPLRRAWRALERQLDITIAEAKMTA
jgi:hypothetical protein